MVGPWKFRSPHPDDTIDVTPPRSATWITFRLAVVALGLAARVINTTTGFASEEPPARPEPASSSNSPSPTQIYRSACLQCHDRDGQGAVVRDAFPTIPDFTYPTWHASRTDENLSRTILRGKGQAMRPMKKVLGSLDVTQMVSFVRAFRGGGLVVLDETETPPAAVGVDGDDSKPAVARPRTDHPRPSPGSSNGHPAEAAFRANCQECHGTDGKGTTVREAMPTIPDFTNAEWQASRSDAVMRHSISEGKEGLMPPMKDKLAASRTDVSDLVAFVRGFAAKTNGVAAGRRPEPFARSASRAVTVPGTSIPSNSRRSSAASASATSRSREASALYHRLCIGCHGQDGRGSQVRGAMPAVPDFTSRAWQSGRDGAQLSVSVLEGKGSLMPPWRGKVSADQARDLVTYVRAFGPGGPPAGGAAPSECGARCRRLKGQWDELDKQAQSLLRP